MNIVGKAIPGTVVEWLNGRTDVVKEKCNQNVGNWVCISCKKVLRNNFDKEVHTETGIHILAWNCHIHGLEEP